MRFVHKKLTRQCFIVCMEGVHNPLHAPDMNLTHGRSQEGFRLTVKGPRREAREYPVLPDQQISYYIFL